MGFLNSSMTTRRQSGSPGLWRCQAMIFTASMPFGSPGRRRLANTQPSTSSKLRDRKSTRLNSSHTVIYTLSLHDALPIWTLAMPSDDIYRINALRVTWTTTTREHPTVHVEQVKRSEEHTSELQSHSDLHSFPTRRSSDLDSGDAKR